MIDEPSSGPLTRRRHVFAGLLWLPRAPAPSEHAIHLALNRRGVLREELIDVVPVGPLALLFGAAWISSDPTGASGWLFLAGFIALWGLGSGPAIVIWLRRIAPVVIDAEGIDLQGSGRVPWDEIRAVVIERDRILLELNQDTTVFVKTGRFPPWFTGGHEDLLGDAAWFPGGHIHVPLRWVDAAPEQIATQIRRFATVRFRAAGLGAASKSCS